MKYTAEQYEAMAKHLRESTPNWHRESFGDFKACVMTCDRAPKDAADMLDEAAALLREQAKGAQGEAVAWGLFAVGGEVDGKLVEFADDEFEAKLRIKNWPVNDNAVLRTGPLYTAPRAAVPDGWKE